MHKGKEEMKNDEHRITKGGKYCGSKLVSVSW